MTMTHINRLSWSKEISGKITNSEAAMPNAMAQIRSGVTISVFSSRTTHTVTTGVNDAISVMNPAERWCAAYSTASTGNT